MKTTPTPRRAPRGLAALVFALLVAATVAAFAWAQHLKREPLVLDRVTFGNAASRAFTPNGDCRFDHGRIRFRVTRSDEAVVQVVTPDRELVRTLARGRFLKRYRFVTFYWDGRDDAGRLQPPGRYKLRVRLIGQDRNLVPGGALLLHRAARRPPPGCEKEATGL